MLKTEPRTPGFPTLLSPACVQTDAVLTWINNPYLTLSLQPGAVVEAHPTMPARPAVRLLKQPLALVRCVGHPQ